MKGTILGTLIALVLLVGGSDVLAQGDPGVDESKRWTGRVFLNVNGGYQPTSSGFDYIHTDMILSEEQVGAAAFNGVGGPILDVGGGVRLAGNLGLGVAYSRYRAEQTADLSASVPHPFTIIFERGPQPMVDELQVLDLGREENVLHIQAIYMFPITHRLQVGVFGGPSYFKCKQDLIRNYMFELRGDDLDNLNIELLDPRDLDDIVTEKASAWGYNVGADVNYLFSDHIGIGMVVRYSGASVDFENPIDVKEERSQPQSFAVDLGGFQVAGGLRIRF